MQRSSNTKCFCCCGQQIGHWLHVTSTCEVTTAKRRVSAFSWLFWQSCCFGDVNASFVWDSLLLSATSTLWLPVFRRLLVSTLFVSSCAMITWCRWWEWSGLSHIDWVDWLRISFLPDAYVLVEQVRSCQVTDIDDAHLQILQEIVSMLPILLNRLICC